MISNYLSKLNPLSWMPSVSDYKAQSDAFINQQQSYNYNNQLYPFTPNNPFDSWIKKLRISYLGESAIELTNRMNFKKDILFDLTNLGSYASPLVSAQSSPNIGNIGLGLKNISGSSFMGQIEASTSYAHLSDKLSSIPHTPKLSPQLPQIPLEVDEWVNNEVSGSANDTFLAVQKWRIKYDKLPTGPASIGGIETSENKWKYLDFVE